MNVTNHQPVCRPYTLCSTNEYQSQPPTYTEDRVCSPLDSIATCTSDDEYSVSQASQRVENLASYHACMKNKLNPDTTYADSQTRVIAIHDACVIDNSV